MDVLQVSDHFSRICRALACRQQILEGFDTFGAIPTLRLGRVVRCMGYSPSHRRMPCVSSRPAYPMSLPPLVLLSPLAELGGLRPVAKCVCPKLLPYTSHLLPHSFYLTPYTLHLTPYTLHLTPSTSFTNPKNSSSMY